MRARVLHNLDVVSFVEVNMRKISKSPSQIANWFMSNGSCTSFYFSSSSRVLWMCVCASHWFIFHRWRISQREWLFIYCVFISNILVRYYLSKIKLLTLCLHVVCSYNALLSTCCPYTQNCFMRNWQAAYTRYKYFDFISIHIHTICVFSALPINLMKSTFKPFDIATDYVCWLFAA